MKKLYKVMLMLAVIALVGGMGSVIAKYIRTNAVTGSLTITAQLADKFYLKESKVTRQTDGTYRLSDGTANTDNEPVSVNSYILMPGVDVPKDPYIVIENKSAIDAYLFVEVVENCPDAVTYTMKNNWIKLEDIVGKNGGVVYVYSEDNAKAPILDEEFTTQTVGILTNDTVYVSDSLNSTATFSMSFYADLVQVVNDETAVDAYTNKVTVYSNP